MSTDNTPPTPTPAPWWRHIANALPATWNQMVGAVILALVSAILAWLGLTPAPQINIRESTFEPTAAHFGWQANPEAVKAIVDALPVKTFAATPAGMAQEDLPEAVYLWQAYSKIFGRGPPVKDQGAIGSCVSFGTNNAVCRSLAVQIVTKGGNAQEYRDFSEEVTYGGSRVEIGGGRLGNEDGSIGAWAAQFVQQWGMVSRETHGTHNLTQYSVSTCKTFGRLGVPAELEKIAKKYPVKSITQVKAWKDAKRALANGYAIAICSDQGFTMARDINGIARPSGQWMHCMALDGYALINGKEYGHIQNSWGGNAHTGPTGPGDPDTGGFWALSTVVNRMLAQNDSWAFSGVTGFPVQRLDWFVMGRRPRQPLAIFARTKGDLSCLDFSLAF